MKPVSQGEERLHSGPELENRIGRERQFACIFIPSGASHTGGPGHSTVFKFAPRRGWPKLP